MESEDTMSSPGETGDSVDQRLGATGYTAATETGTGSGVGTIPKQSQQSLSQVERHMQNLQKEMETEVAEGRSLRTSTQIQSQQSQRHTQHQPTQVPLHHASDWEPLLAGHIIKEELAEGMDLRPSDSAQTQQHQTQQPTPVRKHV